MMEFELGLVSILPIILIILLSFLLRVQKGVLPGPKLHFVNELKMFYQLHFLYTVPEFAEYWMSKYGNLIGVSINGEYTILSSSPEWAYEILQGTENKNFIQRTASDDGLREIGMFEKGIIWNNNPDKWSLQRKVFQDGLSKEVRDQARSLAGELTQKAIKDIKESALGGSFPKVNLLNTIRNITLGVILQVALGIKLDEKKSQRLIECIVEYFKAWEFFLLKPKFVWVFHWKKVQKHRKAIKNLQQEISELETLLTHDSTPFLQSLYKKNLSKEEILQCLLEMVLAGTDTSSVSVYYTMLLVSERSDIQNTLLDSIQTDEKYVESVLREGMRLMPVGPVIIRKARQDCKIKWFNSNIDVKAGTNVVIQLAMQNRDSIHFKEPTTFNPTRFLENDKLCSMSAPMGLGPKSCVGQHLAMVEMVPIMVQFTKAFSWTRNIEEEVLKTKMKWDVAQQPEVDEILLPCPRKKVVFLGAHSVGKTTLSSELVKITKAKYITEVARNLMKDMKILPEELRKNPQNSFELQKAIILKYAQLESDLKYEFTVFDRCTLDALVYAKTFCANWETLLELKETKTCLEHYRSDHYVLFLIEPHQECLQDDNTRMLPKDMEEWLLFSNTYKTLMDHLSIPYHTISTLHHRLPFVCQHIYQ